MPTNTPIALSAAATLDEVIAALAAHLNAGAGTLMIKRDKLYLIINQPDRAALQAIQRHTGGGIAATRNGGKEYPMLQLSGTRAAVVLAAVWPLLTHKGRHELVEGMLDHWTRGYHAALMQRTLYAKQITWADKILAEMQRRGWDTSTLMPLRTRES